MISAVDNSERERKVVSGGVNTDPKNNFTTNYVSRTRKSSSIKSPSTPVTFEALEEQRLKHKPQYPCRRRSVFRDLSCSNTRKQPSITGSISVDVQQRIAAASTDLSFSLHCSPRDTTGNTESILTHGDNQATSADPPPFHIPGPPSCSSQNTRKSSSPSRNTIQSKGDGRRLRVTLRVVNPAIHDSLNSVKNNIVIRQGSGKGEVIVTNPSKVSPVAAALSQTNLTSFDWAKVFNFDSVVFVDANGNAAGEEHQPRKEMEDVFESTVRPVLQGVFDEGISGAIFALQPLSLPCRQGATVENNRMCGMFDVCNSSIEGGGESVAQRTCLEIGHYLDKQHCSVSLCFLHIGDNGIRDLLNDHHRAEERHHPIRVREHPEMGPIAENATNVRVLSANQLQLQLRIGSVALKNLEKQQLNDRTTGCAMLILDITRLVHGVADNGNVNGSDEPEGSEIDDVKDLNTSASGNTRLCLIDLPTKLSISINTDPSICSSSLSKDGMIHSPVSPRRETSRAPTALGKVLHGLAIDVNSSRVKTKTRFPWRDSNMTWLLQGTLGKRRAQASLLVTVSSSTSNYHQSMATLLYVERIMMPSSKTIGQAGYDYVSLKEQSNPEIHEKVRQLVRDLKEVGGEVTSDLLFNTLLIQGSVLQSLWAQQLKNMGNSRIIAIIIQQGKSYCRYHPQ